MANAKPRTRVHWQGRRAYKSKQHYRFARRVDTAGGTIAVPPIAHAPSHEDGGFDEIDVTDLSGQLADPQKVTVEEENVSIGDFDTLNFEGDSVLAFPDGDTADVVIDPTIECFEIYNFRTFPVSGTAATGDFILADASAGDITITIPETDALNDGHKIAVQRVDDTPANTVTVAASGADQFFGAAIGAIPNTSFTIKKQGNTVTLASDDGSDRWRLD